jgi:hypothetical protein
VLVDLDALGEQSRSDRPSTARSELVKQWIEGAETGEEPDNLVVDLEELREAAPIASEPE